MPLSVRQLTRAPRGHVARDAPPFMYQICIALPEYRTRARPRFACTYVRIHARTLRDLARFHTHYSHTRMRTIAYIYGHELTTQVH